MTVAGGYFDDSSMLGASTASARWRCPGRARS